MTVKELKTLLETLPEDALVVDDEGREPEFASGYALERYRTYALRLTGTGEVTYKTLDVASDSFLSDGGAFGSDEEQKQTNSAFKAGKRALIVMG